MHRRGRAASGSIHQQEGNLLVRLFYKNINPRYEELAAMTDEQLVEVAREDIKLSLGIEEEPTVVNVTKWIDQMPRYDLAHNEALSVVVERFSGPLSKFTTCWLFVFWCWNWCMYSKW